MGLISKVKDGIKNRTIDALERQNRKSQDDPITPAQYGLGLASTFAMIGCYDPEIQRSVARRLRLPDNFFTQMDNIAQTPVNVVKYSGGSGGLLEILEAVSNHDLPGEEAGIVMGAITLGTAAARYIYSKKTGEPQMGWMPISFAVSVVTGKARQAYEIFSSPKESHYIDHHFNSDYCNHTD